MTYNGNETPLTALTEQLGGESQLNSFVMMFSASALRDLELQVAFKGMDAEAVADHMINLIKMVFGYTCRSSMINSTIRGQIVLRNYAIFELGLSRGQLSKLHDHFEDALSDSFSVGGAVMECCMDRFTDLCTIVEVDSKGFRQQCNDDFRSNDPAMIMMMAQASRRHAVPKAA
ncbi:MAG: hypothetical protein SGBAC_008190 [Bacillariaceae sp.]